MWKLIDKLTIFFTSFFNAVKFAVLDYDSKLSQTKTTRQRVIIWSTVTIFTIMAIYLFFWILRFFITSFFH